MASFLLMLNACSKKNDLITSINPENTSANNSSARLSATELIEDFELGAKTAYTAADVTLGSGIWNLNDALIGNTTSDKKTGIQSARIRNSGKLTMKFDKTAGAGTVTVYHAKYGTDAAGQWQLWYSTNGGSTYIQSGSTITTSLTSLTASTFNLNISGNVRIELRKSDAGTNRINIDDINISDYSSTNPLPVLSSISPNSANAGSAAVTITVNGSNFINGSLIQWNGTALPTTFVSSVQLSASIPATNLATPGTALVNVITAAPGGGTTSNFTFTINAAAATAKRFLFDAKHAQTAGNADWVIDEDSSTPQRIPTPAQSNITSTTSESYWTGAISSWGIALVKLGHFVETLPASGSLTYGNTSNTQDLSNYNVFVVDEPNTRFTTAEKTAIMQFVQNGGSLFMIADHTLSDRNNDGWDSPAIWNDFMSTNSMQSNPFGFSFQLTDISGVSNNVLPNTSNKILNGSQGTVSQLEFNNGATISLTPTANTTVQGIVWKSGVTQGTTNALCVTATYGNGGRIFAIADSSPMDDGTGAAGNLLFPGWTSYSHKQLMMNASLWLAKLQ